MASPQLRPLTPSGGDSTGGALSGDGQIVAFVSAAANLATNVHHGQVLDVYVRYRQTGVVSLVSAGVDGSAGGDDHSSGPALSADGRWAVFESRASNLVTNHVSGTGDIYVRDLTGGMTRLVSVNSADQGGNGVSHNAHVTPDGRFVVFESDASDLSANDTNGATDVFVRDLKTGTTTLVGVNWLGTASAASADWLRAEASTRPVITPDGRYVAFQSLATNLVQGTVWPANSQLFYSQVYVRDLLLETTLLLSASPSSQPGSDDSENPRISADGRYVAFQSRATNLTTTTVPSQTPLVYRRDLMTGTTSLISPLSGDGAVPNVGAPDLSTNGQVIAYADRGQIYVWHEGTGAVSLMSTNGAGQPASGQAYSPVLSADGNTLAYLSDATDAVANATNGQFQVVLRDLVAGTNWLASSSPAAPAGSGADCRFLALSPNGKVVMFQAFDDSLVPGGDNNAIDVFVRDAASAGVELVSGSVPSLPPTTGVAAASLPDNPVSSDGRYVLFTSAASNLALNDTNGANDVFVRDTVWGTTALVSVNQAGTGPGNGSSQMPVMTPDGRFVAFVSSATNLVAGDTNDLTDVFVRDLLGGTTVLASVPPAGLARGPVHPLSPIISADGRYVAFALDTPAGGIGGVFLRDLQRGTTTSFDNLAPWLNWPYGIMNLVALTPDQGLWCFALANSPAGATLLRLDLPSGTNQLIRETSILPVVTPDGRFATGQFLRFGNGQYTNEVWRYDRQTASLRVIFLGVGTNSIPSTQGWSLSISANGQLIAFVIPAANPSTLAQWGGTNNVYVADANQPGKFVLASVNQTGTAAGNGASDSPCLSADGRFVSFRSSATDLVPGVTSVGPNLYVRDLQTGITRLVSANVAGTGGDARSIAARVSADGTTVAFESGASDLISGDYNNLPDVFVYRIPREPVVQVRLLPLSFGQRPTVVWNAESGRTYQVQFKNLLGDVAWQDLSGNPMQSGANELQLQDTSPDRGNQRYYRLVLLP